VLHSHSLAHKLWAHAIPTIYWPTAKKEGQLKQAELNGTLPSKDKTFGKVSAGFV